MGSTTGDASAPRRRHCSTASPPVAALVQTTPAEPVMASKTEGYSSKDEASTLIQGLVKEKYKGGGIKDHILSMSDRASKLDSMGVGLKNETLVQLILASLPKDYEIVVVNYNLQPDSYDIEKLIAMCVHEERKKD